MSHILLTHKKGRPFQNTNSYSLNNNYCNKNVKNDKQITQRLFKMHVQRQSIKLQKIVYPCCNEAIFSQQIHNQSQQIINQDIYLMPCGHNMCHKCIIEQIVPSKLNCRIKCKILQCIKDYSIHEAENVFIKNHAVKNFLEKLYLIKNAIQNKCIQTQKMSQSIQLLQRRNLQARPLTIHYESAEVSGQNIKMQIDQQKHHLQNSDCSSEQPSYNPCINMFCKKPTLGLFCSERCQIFYDQININEQIMMPDLNNLSYPSFQFINNI